jgi:hypothetical protein
VTHFIDKDNQSPVQCRQKMDLPKIWPDSALMPGLISHVVIGGDNGLVLYWEQPIFIVFLVLDKTLLI